MMDMRSARHLTHLTDKSLNWKMEPDRKRTSKDTLEKLYIKDMSLHAFRQTYYPILYTICILSFLYLHSILSKTKINKRLGNNSAIGL